MNTIRRGLQRPKGSLDNDGDTLIEKESNKKIKLEDEALSNLDMDNDFDEENLGEFKSRRWSSSYKDKSKGRIDNSLSVLTRKFIQLIKNSPNFTVDLNDAVGELNVQKRRIYDITNVLEGIGYIRKVHKNKIRWVGNTENFSSECDPRALARELESLFLEEREVMKWTNNLQEMLADLANDESTNEYSFVNFDDIKGVNNLPKGEGQPFLVIRAPKGALLEVPNSETDRTDELPYKMTLVSENEEILIYVVSNDSTEVSQEA